MEEHDVVGVRALGVVVHAPAVGGFGELLVVDQNMEWFESASLTGGGSMTQAPPQRTSDMGWKAHATLARLWWVARAFQPVGLQGVSNRPAPHVTSRQICPNERFAGSDEIAVSCWIPPRQLRPPPRRRGSATPPYTRLEQFRE